jgi:hypothetical protein
MMQKSTAFTTIFRIKRCYFHYDFACKKVPLSLHVKNSYLRYKCKKLSFIARTGLKYDRGTREYFKRCESHRRGRIFSKEGTSAGPWMCVYVSSGLTVGWWKEDQHSFGHHGEVSTGSSPVGKRRPWVYKCGCVCL